MPDRYSNIKEFKTDRGVRYKTNAIYPNIPLSDTDIYILATGGDRYDTLAQQFYNDSSLWWVIASANNFNKDGMIVRPGVQLRIPVDGQGVKALYESLNENR